MTLGCAKFILTKPMDPSINLFLAPPKQVMILPKSLQKASSNLKQLIANICMDKAIAFKRISFSLWDRFFFLPCLEFLPNLVFDSSKGFSFGFPNRGFKPRYLSYGWRVPLVHKAIKASQVWLRVFLLNTIVVVSVFMHCLEASSYTSSNCYTFLVVLTSTLQKSILLSINRRWFIGGVPLHTFIPGIWTLWDVIFNKLISHSVQGGRDKRIRDPLVSNLQLE